MVQYIDIDIPQLPIWETPNYSGIIKKFKDHMQQSFLLRHLNERFLDYSIRHYVLNEHLRNIYLSHAQLAQSRIDEDMYLIDHKHYHQLFLTDQVCQSLSAIAAELCYSIYNMKYLNEKGQFPERIEISKAIEIITNDPMLRNYFSSFEHHFKLMDKIRRCNHLNSIHATYDRLLTERNPVLFVTDENQKVEQFPLSQFIDVYCKFFLTCKRVLISHSPELAIMLLKNWKE